MEMAGKEFTGKDKTVQKMTRDGLIEKVDRQKALKCLWITDM